MKNKNFEQQCEMIGKLTNKDGDKCVQHCWHHHRGPIHMFIRPGFMVQECCRCCATRQVHMDHVVSDRVPYRLCKDIVTWRGKANPHIKPMLAL